MSDLKDQLKHKMIQQAATEGDVMEKAKKNVFKTMLLLTVCYVICYVFNSVYITLIIEGTYDSLSGE